MIEDVLSGLEGVRRSGKGYVARCPSHQDRHPSLFVTSTGDRVLMHCYAGCHIEDICSAIGLEVKDLFKKDIKPKERHRINREQSLQDKFNHYRQEAFLEMVEFRNLARDLYEDEKLEASGDVLWAKHKEPLIDYCLYVLAVGTKEEVIDLMQEGVVEKWVRLRNSPKRKQLLSTG